MKEKVILICIDGMRPDGFLACGNPFIHEMMKLGSYCLESRSVFPSSTLPCHMSMFHSVPPERHGILSNTYVPMVRPLNGLFEQIKFMGGVSDMYYGWEPLRDISQPKSLARAGFIYARGEENTDNKLTDMALTRIREDQPDFIFLYLVETDEKGGHDNGWMSEAYLHYIDTAISNVKRVYDAVQELGSTPIDTIQEPGGTSIEAASQIAETCDANANTGTNAAADATTDTSSNAASDTGSEANADANTNTNTNTDSVFNKTTHDYNYTIIVTADHGGHDRLHGTDLKEDMTIPTFFIGKRFEPGKQLTNVSIMDLAPTVVNIMGIPQAPEWEGKNLAE